MKRSTQIYIYDEEHKMDYINCFSEFMKCIKKINPEMDKISSDLNRLLVNAFVKRTQQMIDRQNFIRNLNHKFYKEIGLKTIYFILTGGLIWFLLK